MQIFRDMQPYDLYRQTSFDYDCPIASCPLGSLAAEQTAIIRP